MGLSMHLKSLEIQGFKSFPDKISLNFDKGLTAVVGPNGSGKSNISDSVRWVLGEQSTKNLRGNKMEDVIFSGTVARKPMGFASVTLSIDNSNHALADYGDEVAVTRKLYRSGESEYMINGRTVRLRDINELFMDTGLGRDGYSIVSQGRIAEIVGAKSDERRDIFEEAAGISKLRYRKNESERKLRLAQENILRLTDIISELEGRVEPLKQQAAKAEKFIVLAEKRRNLEISVWVRSLNEIKEKLDSLDEKILASQAEFENLDNDITNEEERIQTIYRQIQECTVETDRVQQCIIASEQQSSDLKSDAAVFENDIKHCNEMIQHLNERKIKGDEAKSELAQAIELAKKNLISLRNDKADSEHKIIEVTQEFEKTESESRAKSSDFDGKNSEINALYIKQSEYRVIIEGLERNITDLTADKDRLFESGEVICRGIEGYTVAASALKKRLNEETSEVDELRNKLSGYEKLEQSKRKSYENAKYELEDLVFELKGIEQRRKLLTDLEQSMEGFSGSVKEILKTAKRGGLSGVLGTVAQNITTAAEYGTAIETALGAAMQNIVVENEDIAKRCITHLKEQRAGRATFLPLTSVKGNTLNENGLETLDGFVGIAENLVSANEKFRLIVKSLLGRTVIAEDIDSATQIARKYGYRFKIVTLDGQVINAGGSFTGGSTQKTSGSITRKNEIEQLNVKLGQLNAKQNELGSRTERLRQEAEKYRIETEGMRKSLSEAQTEVIRLNSELSGIITMRENSEKQLADIEKQKSDNIQKIDMAKEEIEKLRSETDRVSEILKNLEISMNESLDERNRIQEKREKLSQKLSDLRIRDAEIAKDCEAAQREIDNLEADAKELTFDFRRIDKEIASHERTIEEKLLLIEKRKTGLEAVAKDVEGYREQIKRHQTMHSDKTRAVKEAQMGLRALNDAKGKLSGEITRLEERRSTFRRDSDEIVAQLLETYEITRSEAIEAATPIEDMAAAKRDLFDIKNKIRLLGSVNVGAIDEYREVFQRYSFMSGQLDDIKKSKRELERIIGDLLEEMRRIFTVSFEIINSNFKQIFVELFGGGKAELRLTDPEDVLESGVEINVAPPGKVIKNLISLSGGEQAFVAIAIYFAILRLRPAPFCILDEIDAALDEANVSRYAQYLRNFTDTTQFILVTHRRGTMDVADVLYGVTMQADGISKLLKLEQNIQGV